MERRAIRNHTHNRQDRGRDYAEDIPVSAAIPLEANNIIQYLWARTRVERLTDYGMTEDLQPMPKKK